MRPEKKARKKRKARTKGLSLKDGKQRYKIDYTQTWRRRGRCGGKGQPNMNVFCFRVTKQTLFVEWSHPCVIAPSSQSQIKKVRGPRSLSNPNRSFPPVGPPKSTCWHNHTSLPTGHPSYPPVYQFLPGCQAFLTRLAASSNSPT